MTNPFGSFAQAQPTVVETVAVVAEPAVMMDSLNQSAEVSEAINTIANDMAVGVDPTAMVSELPALPDADKAKEKMVRRLPNWALTTKKEIFNSIDIFRRLKAATMCLTQNACREVACNDDEAADNYSLKVVSALYFGESFEKITRKGDKLRFEMAADPAYIEELYNALPIEVRNSAKNLTADGKKVASTSVLDGAVKLINMGVARETVIASFGLTPKRIALLDQKLAGVDTAIAEEALDVQEQ